MKKISFELKIENQLSEIVKVISHFKTFSSNHDFDEKLVGIINIAFDELLNNTISYGYKDKREHEIIIHLEIAFSDLIIRIIDDGLPYNPFLSTSANTTLSIEEREIGGLGIHIVKTIMDECTYARNENKNTITLIKHNIN